MSEARIPVYEISISSRNLEEINEKIDVEIKKHFIGQRICIRVLGSEIHKGKTIDELIGIIINTGTDRYDPLIKSERYYNQEGKHVDFFALDFFINQKMKILDQFTWRKKLRPPLKIDVVIIYDIEKLVRVVYTPLGRVDKKDDGFSFKDTSSSSAIKAIFKISS